MMRRRVGRPLLRTAVVGGAAYMAGSAATRNSYEREQREQTQEAQIAELQQQQMAMQQQPTPMDVQQPVSPAALQTPRPPQPDAPEAPTATPTKDPIQQLKALGELKAAGIVTEEEFQAKKAELLRQI